MDIFQSCFLFVLCFRFFFFGMSSSSLIFSLVVFNWFLITSSEILFQVLCFSYLKVSFGVYIHSAMSLYSGW